MATHTHADQETGRFKLAEMTAGISQWNDTLLGATIYVDEETSTMGEIEFHFITSRPYRRFDDY